ncbi:MAG: ATPase [Pseudomonadota bacterium]
MLYDSPSAFAAAPQKHLLFFGMSGLGKTHLANLLRGAGEWFHYSIDYRIGTAYMGEHIADNLKRQAMQVPFLAELLRSDSIYLGSNITFDNLAPLSTFLGKPGDPAKGGLPFAEYMRRQELHRRAEINALLDTPAFIARARDLYGYPHFVADTGGSICEVVDPENPEDPVLGQLRSQCLMVWIEAADGHTEELIARFRQAPKPMYYDGPVMTALWTEFLKLNNTSEGDVDPDDFVTFAYSSAIVRRAPIYAAMARYWGISVRAADVATVRDAADCLDLVASALGKQGAAA